MYSNASTDGHIIEDRGEFQLVAHPTKPKILPRPKGIELRGSYNVKMQIHQKLK